MDEQVELLRGIWNEMKALNGRIDTTNAQLGEVRTEMRTGLTEVRAGLTEVRTGLTEVRESIVDLRERIDTVHSRSVHRDMRVASSVAQLSLNVRDLTLVIHEWHDDQRLDREYFEGEIERLRRHLGLEPR